jgi:hypothetical protein
MHSSRHAFRRIPALASIFLLAQVAASASPDTRLSLTLPPE